MKKYVLLCGFSALLGGLLSTAFKTHSVEPRASAQDVPGGLRPAVEDEFTAAEPDRIRVIQANNQTKIEQLARKSPIKKYPAERLRLLNDLYPDKEPTPGQKLKIVE